MMYSKFVIIIFASILLSSCSTPLPKEVEEAYEKLPDDLSFNFDVKPILSDKCFACHGPDEKKRESGLRLDIEEAAFKALGEDEDYYAIVPGSLSKSTAVERILSQDPDLVMPTPESHLVLTAKEKATLIKWINDGAKYEKHWAFIPVEEADIPDVENEEWVQNGIDNFVLDKLEQKGIQTSPKASKETLIRRVSFDLTGLPPTLAEIDFFVKDKSSDAFEKMVDRYLASSAYGERMASDWMDVSRYTDSDGYLDDKHRDFSPWRDWVINAFNKNMSYQQFVTWQLAGDLVENKSKESILATAFNRLHRKNSEAGIIYEEFRTEYVADRTLTLGKAFMGLTLECARCHDHKYDPISQKDYYSMFAFFNSTNEWGHAVYGPDQTPGPALLLSTDEQDKLITFLKTKVSKTENSLRAVKHTESIPAFTTAELSKGINSSLEAYYPFEKIQLKKDKVFTSNEGTGKQKPLTVKEPNIKKGKVGNALFLNEFTNAKLPPKVAWKEHTESFSIGVSIFPDTLYEDVNIFSHAEDDRNGLKGYSMFLTKNKLRFVLAHSYPQNAIEIVAKNTVAIKKWTDVVLTYDGSGKASGVHLYLNGKPQEVTVNANEVYKSILFRPDIHTYGFSGLQFGVVGRIVTFKNGGLDEFRLFNKELSALEVLHLYDPKESMKAIVGKSKLLAQHLNLEAKRESPTIKELQKWRDSLNVVVDAIPEIMVMGDLPTPRKTFVLDRGVYDAPTDEVKPNTVAAVLPFSEDLPQNRLGLTEWLFDSKNPLTARVFVNRIWAMHFGEGLVKSHDDFGNQGNIPTHPQLLDYLADGFVKSGWDIKLLHKTILSSATFQQNSKVRKELIDIDPQNELLARGPSFRFSAEMIRDNALSISGLLVNKNGGESVFPYQPAGLWDEISNKPWRYKYLQEPGEGLYRRSLYTVWKRTSPPPSMMIFDASDRTVCTVKRRNTSTPLQALVLLNDPQIIEASRVLAEKLLTIENKKEKFLIRAFRETTGRQPDAKEISLLTTFYDQQEKKYMTKKKDAIDYLSTGELKINESLDPAKTAALALTINGLLNTSEGYSRN
ncbi:Concanavalin A-like lectin/glucanases superfamily protein [Spirosomataceae bacterium TFI 002]|nr:Concanavalin A-like lectin/glucanases superfamily protein [Spirosomataceae bacterium TFI 002]